MGVPLPPCLVPRNPHTQHHGQQTGRQGPATQRAPGRPSTEHCHFSNPLIQQTLSDLSWGPAPS